MHIVKRPSEFSSDLGLYSVEWHHQAGDAIEKDELLGSIHVIVWLYEIIFKQKPEKLHYYLLSPVDGVLQQILELSEDDIELALISTIPEPLDNIKIFYSYASEDELLRKELEKQLSILRRQGFVVEWHEGNITAGIEKQKEADLYLNTAHIILLLVSPDFMATDNCYSFMQRALQRHQRKEARVVPVLLRPSDWKVSPLAELQVLPANEISITRWNDRDEAFLNVAQGIRRVIQEMLEDHLQEVQVLLSQEIEQNRLLSSRTRSLREKIDVNNKRLRRLSEESLSLVTNRRVHIVHGEIGIIQKQRNIYQEIYDKLVAEKNNLESIRANFQKELEIPAMDISISSTISGLREEVNSLHSKFSSEIDTIQKQLQSYQETLDKLTKEKADLASTQTKLQKQLEKITLISSMSSEEIKKLQEQERKTSEILEKIKF